MTNYVPNSEKCVVVSVPFLEMIADTNSATKLIREMRDNGNHIVLPLRTNEENYNLSTARIPTEEFSEVQEMVTLSNPENYEVLARKHENGKAIKKFEKTEMFLLDIYAPCQKAMTDYGGTAIDTSSGDIKKVRKILEEYNLL